MSDKISGRERRGADGKADRSKRDLCPTPSRNVFNAPSALQVARWYLIPEENNTGHFLWFLPLAVKSPILVSVLM